MSLDVNKMTKDQLRQHVLMLAMELTQLEKKNEKLQEKVNTYSEEYGKLKEEKKADVYYLKVPTFRRTVQLHIGGGKEYFDKMFGEYGYNYDLTTGFFCFDDKNNCNILWLSDYSLSTLVHELFHCVISILDQIGEDRANGEAPAYIYEELFTKIWHHCGSKFKLDKELEKYFFEE